MRGGKSVQLFGCQKSGVPIGKDVMKPYKALIAGAIVWAFGVMPAHAEYPERTITLVVNFAAGGGTDVAARMLAVPLAATLDRPVVLENRVGPGGNIGITAVARAQPDG
jgi:tripartite-type tricarboxylate transporter receptor subunit TctC